MPRTLSPRKSLTLALLALAALGFAQEHKHSPDEKHKLGRKQINGYTVSVILIGSELSHAGETAKFDIKLIDAKTEPKALRVWVGTADAPASAKVAGVKGKTTYTGSLTAPSPYPKDAQLWVEIETDSGTAAGSYKLEAHDHKH